MIQNDRESVLLVDGHPITRLGTRTALTMDERWHVCGEADLSGPAIALAEELRPSLCILDLALPRTDGMALLRDLTKIAPQTRSVVFTAMDDADAVRRAFGLGAWAYVLKSESPRLLQYALYSVCSGKRYASPDLEQTLLGSLVPQRAQVSTGQISLLTNRELSVFRRLGAGESSRNIAKALGVSPRTVETHCERTKMKLGLNSMAELRVRAARETLRLG